MKTATGYFCNQKKIKAYFERSLDSDEELDFLLHLDECKLCRDSLFEIMKDSHEDYYRKVSGNKIKKELKEISKLVRNDDSRSSDEMPDVA